MTATPPPDRDTIAAIATAPGAGGVGIVRLSGPRALAIGEALVARRLRPRHAHHVRFVDAAGEVIDDGIALYFAAPASYTGEDVVELQAYLADPTVGQTIQAVPSAGSKVPIWLLGSSLFSAQLAAALGLPFAFAAHFAPDSLMQALDLYRRAFRPSAQRDRPHVMVCLNVVAAETDAEARRLFTSLQQSFVNLRRGRPGQLPPPVEDISAVCTHRRSWPSSPAPSSMPRWEIAKQ